MKNIYVLLTLCFVVLSGMTLYAQQKITIYSIDNARQPGGDNGYTLNGGQMSDARSKLLNTNLFGSNGVYPKTISIVDTFSTSGSLKNIASVSGIDLFFFGTFNTHDPSLVQFTTAEIDSLYNWSLRGGKMIIGATAVWPDYDVYPNILDAKWGFNVTLADPTNIFPEPPALNSKLFNGPFGKAVNGIVQGGSIQGYFSHWPFNIVILAGDGKGHPTMYLDCKTLDLLVADADIYTSLGSYSPGASLLTANDTLWANTIAYMDSIDGPPVIIQKGDSLSTGLYNSYQWYLDGNIISGGTSKSIKLTQTGVYSVHVPLACGCSDVSSANFGVTMVGIGEPKSNLSLSIYPNPTAGMLAIQSSSIHEGEKVTIYVLNMLGEIVKMDNLAWNGKTFINTASLTPGIYSIQIKTTNGLSVKKFIKK